MLLPVLLLADTSLLTALTINGLLLLVLVALSAAYSGSEPVLFSLTRTQLQHDRASANPFRRLAAVLMDRPQRTLTIILLGNTAVNVLLYANTYVLFRALAPVLGVGTEILAAVFSILVVSVLCEALPKTLGLTLADRLAPFCAPLIHFSGYVLGPAGRLLDILIIEPASRLLWGPRAAQVHTLSRLELKTLLEMSRRQGVINPVEDALLREVIDLGALRVRDVMVPRVEVKSYDLNAPAEGLRALMRTTRRKKIPVYDGVVDNIVGLIYAKVLFLNPGVPLRQVVQPVRFVPELITCEQLLLHFRSTRSQLAIAVDEYGGMAGLVTLEDVLEVIVGDLAGPDEAPAEPEIVPVGDGEFDVSGQLGIHYWTQSFGLPPSEARVATVGGLVTAQLGRPARVGDVVRFGQLELRVLSTHRRRVGRLRLRVLEPAAEGDAAGGAGRGREGEAAPGCSDSAGADPGGATR